MPEPIWKRRLSPDELHCLQPLFERVFHHTVSLDLLRWKYASGHGESWTAGQANVERPLLHCGLLFRDILFHGEARRAAQLVDLMAEPKQSGLTRGQSIFTVLMRHLLAQLPGPANPEALAFGFPSDRAMRLGEHNGVYCAVDHWLALNFTPRRLPVGPRLRAWRPTEAGDLALADRLWQRMRGSFSNAVLGVRDAAYLRWRYLTHPEKRYQIFVVESRWRRSPVGLAVLAPGSAPREIVDLIGAWDDLPEILLALQRGCADHAATALNLLLTAGFAASLTPFADTCEATEFRIMANPDSPAAGLTKLRDHWWLTGGDTDYR